MNAAVVACVCGLALTSVPFERWVEPAQVGAWMGVGAGLWSGDFDDLPRPPPIVRDLTRTELAEALEWLRAQVRASKKEGAPVPEGVIRLGLWLRDREEATRA